MTIFDVVISMDDVRQTNWQQLLSECESRDCWTYSKQLFSKADEAKTSGVDGAEKVEAALAVLGYLFSIHHKLDEKVNPYILEIPQAGGASALDVLQQMHLDIFKELLPTIADAEARARIKDILWIKKAVDYRVALTAIDDYLASAQTLEHPDNWPLFVARIERAMQLAASLRNEDALRKVREHIVAVLDKYDGEDRWFMSARLMQFLQGFSEYQSEPNITKYATLAEKSALRREQQNDWYTAREYWRVKAQWHGLGNDAVNKRNALIRAAETYVSEAELNTRIAAQGYSSATRNLIEAIEEFRRIDADETLPQDGNVRLRIDELRHRLADYQKKSLEELQKSHWSLNIADDVIKAQDKVKGKSFIEALLTLAIEITAPIKKAEMRQQIEEAMRNSIYMRIHAHTLDEFGRVIAARPGTFSDSADDQEATLRAEMFRMALWIQDAYGAVIYAVIYQINAEHSIGLRDLLPFVTSHPFVPPGRENIYAQGFYSGLIGDTMQALHLLIPQLENSIRYILRQRGVKTWGLDSVSGIEEDFDLNRLLYMPQLEEILGEDIVFNLRGLLVERFGSNIRNAMAHGQLDYFSFYSHRMTYLWWLILRICCIPIVNARTKPQATVSAEKKDENSESNDTTVGQ